MGRLLHLEKDRQIDKDHKTYSVTVIDEPFDDEYVDVVHADYIDDYLIHVRFSDGSEQTVNFGPFLARSMHPQIRQYLDSEKFQRFEIVGGNLNWNDYELCFPVADLYENRVDKYG